MVKERWRAIEKSPDFSFSPRLRNPPAESRQTAAPWGFAQILQRFSIVVPGERGLRGPVRSFRERKTPPPPPQGAPDPPSVPRTSELETSDPQRSAAFLLSAPWAGLPRRHAEPSSAWLGSLRLAKEDSPASGLGSGADEGSRASCQETVSRNPRLRTRSNNPFRVLASFTVHRLTCMPSTT